MSPVADSYRRPEVYGWSPHGAAVHTAAAKENSYTRRQSVGTMQVGL